MKVSIQVSNLRVAIPEPPAKKPGETYVDISKHRRPYLLFGLNDWFESPKLHREFLTEQICKNGKKNFLQEFTLRGGVQESNKEHLDHYFMGALQVSLLVPIASKKYRKCMQRHGKCVIAWVDWLAAGQSKFHVKLHNKWYEDEVLCEFDLEITELEMPRTLKDLCAKNNSRELRHKLYEEMTAEMKYMRERLNDVTAKLNCLDEEDRRKSLFSSHNFFGERPINNWLYSRLRASNEELWDNWFNTVMLYKRTEMGLDSELSNEDLFWKLSAHEQMVILVDICCLVSVNATYLRDLILRGDGSLDQEKSDDYSDNIQEGGGDCEDLFKEILLVLETFMKSSPFKNRALEELRRRVQRYVCLGALADINTAKYGDPVTTGLHITGVLMHKKLLFMLTKVMLSGKLSHESEIIASRVEDDFYKLREIEEEAGNLETSVVNNHEKQELPLVLMMEGTQFFNPYPIQYNPPNEETVDKELAFEGWRYRDFLAPHRRNYQSPDYQLLVKYWAFYTNYFIEHPVFPVNLPTFMVSTVRRGECTWDKGIYVEDLLSYNLSERERKKLGDDVCDVVIFPSSSLRDLKRSRRAMRYTAMDKFMNCPLVMRNGVVESRVQNDTRDVVPNISAAKRKKIREFMPKSLKNAYYVTFAPNRIDDFLACVDLKKLVGLKFVEILPHITIYIAWVEQDEKKLKY
jgi:hypothetical protein